ncbi:hypothetical protein TESG_06847 [Trichophyton tonsurans CBS 112818]|uniref:Uncharacterized protein n=1 Tax=Trichophyton tonsurans (strain CBS 112818) TaxID=647933 RepID=F2S7N3_TRIT1|nr:hypothetical protein TESG_06847 [Trichophyton tonsurans CBS 112818]
MGAIASKQLAERVIIACEQVDGDGCIDGLLLEDETFSEQLESLSIPASLRRLVKGQKARKSKEDYGEKDITEHPAFRRLWDASPSQLHPTVRRALYDGQRDPSTFFKSNSNGLPQRSSVTDYLDYMYELDQNRQINSIRWKLSLIPILDLFKRFNRTNTNAGTCDDIITVIIQSGLIFRHGDQIRERLPDWLRKSRRYNTLATEVGLGGICVLPEEPGDTMWEKTLPLKGPVHNACLKLLLDRDILGLASERLTENSGDANINTAAETIVNYLRMIFRDIAYLDPEEGLHSPAVALVERPNSANCSAAEMRDESSSQQGAKRRRTNAARGGQTNVTESTHGSWDVQGQERSAVGHGLAAITNQASTGPKATGDRGPQATNASNRELPSLLSLHDTNLQWQHTNNFTQALSQESVVSFARHPSSLELQGQPDMYSTSVHRAPERASLSLYTESQRDTDSNTPTTVSNMDNLSSTRQCMFDPNTQSIQQVEYGNIVDLNASSHVPIVHLDFINPSSYIPQYFHQGFPDFNLSGSIPDPISINNSQVHERDSTYEPI